MQIANIAEIIACIISAFFYQKIKHSFLKWLPLYLLLVSVGELIAHYYSGLLNNYIYITITILTILFYNHCFYQLLQKRKKVQHLIIFLSSILLVIGIYLFVFIAQLQPEVHYLLIALGIELSVIVCIYLYDIFLSDDMQVLLIKQPGFWMSAGVLLFFSGMCFTFAISPIALKYDLKIFDTYLLWFIPRTLSVILYSFLVIAVILYKPKLEKNSRLSNIF